VARAKKYLIPDLIWHLTHRCHNREFHLKFARDRKRWMYWLFQAKKRYGLTILNYSLTSNHVHLLVYDNGRRFSIPRSIQLASGRIAREYNLRKNRSGAFWEDHYHATAIESGEHLVCCMVYIDMNMVRAGVVKHPINWPFCGYNEILGDKKRYRLIDKGILSSLLNIGKRACLKEYYSNLIEVAISEKRLMRESKWTESIAVGRKKYVLDVKKRMGVVSIHKKIEEVEGSHILKDKEGPYY